MNAVKRLTLSIIQFLCGHHAPVPHTFFISIGAVLPELIFVPLFECFCGSMGQPKLVTSGPNVRFVTSLVPLFNKAMKRSVYCGFFLSLMSDGGVGVALTCLRSCYAFLMRFCMFLVAREIALLRRSRAST